MGLSSSLRGLELDNDECAEHAQGCVVRYTCAALKETKQMLTHHLTDF